MLHRKALIRGILLALALAGAGAPGASAAPPPVKSVAVFPFQAQRATEKGRRLAAFAHHALRRALLRSGGPAVLDEGAGAQWHQRFRLSHQARPSTAQLQEAGVEAVVQGSSQLVLQLAIIQLRVTGRSGDLLKEGEGSLRMELDREPPAGMATRLQELLWPVLVGSPVPGPLPQPERWEPLLAYHGLLESVATGGADAGEKRLAALEKLAREEPALEGRARAAMAERLLVQADAREGLARRERLEAALSHAARAARLEPWNPDVLALKGEIHYFLKQYYEAKTDASVARLKNPLNGLAQVVLALAAGLSTGAATEHMEAALRIDPFLRAKNRAPGSSSFQGGTLEPYFARWERLRGRPGGFGPARANPDLKAGIAHFKQERWKEAAEALRRAADADDYDYRPLLYLSRIVIETGDPLEAATQLRKLGTEFPEQPEILFQLGIALERGQAYPDAIQAFRMTLEQQEDHARALFHLGTSTLAAEDWAGAEKIFGRIVDKDAENAGAWLRFGIANAQLKNWRAADEAFRRTLKLEPGSPEAKEWLAWVKPRLEK
jgi:tetratricopeptide (TPR) repeat protein